MTPNDLIGWWLIGCMRALYREMHCDCQIYINTTHTCMKSLINLADAHVCAWLHRGRTENRQRT